MRQDSRTDAVTPGSMSGQELLTLLAEFASCAASSSALAEICGNVLGTAGRRLGVTRGAVWELVADPTGSGRFVLRCSFGGLELPSEAAEEDLPKYAEVMG